MKRVMAVPLLVTALAAPLAADVPEPFRGSWSLDQEASIAAIEAAGDQLTPQQRDRLLRGVNVELVDLVLEITDSAMTFRLGESTQTYQLELQETDEKRAVFQSPEADTVTLAFDADGRLNTRSSKDDDFDHFYFNRQGDAGEAPSTDAVAYLDALKDCAPGEYRLSFPGVATLETRVLGPKGEACEVRILHPEFTLHCEYSARMIELLTSERMYEEARSGVLSGSTDAEISQLASEQCLPQ